MLGVCYSRVVLCFVAVSCIVLWHVVLCLLCCVVSGRAAAGRRGGDEKGMEHESRRELVFWLRCYRILSCGVVSCCVVSARAAAEGVEEKVG